MDHPAKAPGVSFATLTVVEPAPISAASYSLSINPWLCHDGGVLFSLTYTAYDPPLLHPPPSQSSLQFLLAAASILTLSAADWHACLSALFFSPSPSFLSLLCTFWTRRWCTWSRRVSLALVDLSTPAACLRETALYVTLLSLLQSFVGSFQSWALRLMNMYPGLLFRSSFEDL